MKDELTRELDKMTSDFKETGTDGYQFMYNVKAEYKSDIISGHLKLLKQHKSFINKKVYKYVNGFRFNDDIKQQNLHNKLESKSQIFTKDMYIDFGRNLSIFMVKRLTELLTEHTIVNNSTNQLENVKFGLQLECKQELIKLYKKFI